MTTAMIQQDQYPTRTGERHVPATTRTHPTVWGDAADGPFDQAGLDAHASRGFSVLEDFITQDEVELYSSELRRLSADESLRGDPRLITEKSTGAVRSVFGVTGLSEAIDALSRDPRVLDRARQLLGSENDFTIDHGTEPGAKTMEFRKTLLDIQYGRTEDKNNWMVRLA